MSITPIERTRYTPHKSNIPREDPPTSAGNHRDIERYLIPLAQTQMASFFSPGVVSGLQVSFLAGKPNLSIAPGAALDHLGRLIVLAQNGVWADAKEPGKTKRMDDKTATLGTTNLNGTPRAETGDLVLTFGWNEIEGPEPGESSGPWVWKHAPVLGLIARGGDETNTIILADVTLDSKGNVTDVSPKRRRAAGVSVASLRLRDLGTGTQMAQLRLEGEMLIAEASKISLTARHGSERTPSANINLTPTQATIHLSSTGGSEEGKSGANLSLTANEAAGIRLQPEKGLSVVLDNGGMTHPLSTPEAELTIDEAHRILGAFPGVGDKVESRRWIRIKRDRWTRPKLSSTGEEKIHEWSGRDTANVQIGQPAEDTGAKDSVVGVVETDALEAVETNAWDGLFLRSLHVRRFSQWPPEMAGEPNVVLQGRVKITRYLADEGSGPNFEDADLTVDGTIHAKSIRLTLVGGGDASVAQHLAEIDQRLADLEKKLK